MNEKRSSAPGSRTLHLGKIAAAVFWLALIVFIFLHRDAITVDHILGFMPQSALACALLLWGMFAVKGLSIVLYSGILFAASGILFPLPLAIAVNAVGIVLMVSLPFALGRHEGSALIGSLVARYPKAERVRELRQESDFLFTVLLRVARIFPADIVSMYMGAVGAKYRAFLLGSLLGILPQAIIYPIMGSSITAPTSPTFLLSVAAEIAVSLAALLGYHCYRKKRRM